MKVKCIIGISGGSGSGKSRFAAKLKRHLGSERVLILSQDFYYTGKTKEDILYRRQVNFDEPKAIEFQWLIRNINQLISDKCTLRPVYSMKLNKRLPQKIKIHAKEIVIIEGTLIFISPQLRNLCHVRIYLDAPSKVRKKRRVQRDIKNRGRHITDIIKQFDSFVLPMHLKYVEPQKKWAHIIFDAEYTSRKYLNEVDKLVKKQCKMFNNQ